MGVVVTHERRFRCHHVLSISVVALGTEPHPILWDLKYKKMDEISICFDILPQN